MDNKSSGELTLESMDQAGWYNRWLLGKFKKYLKGDILEVGCGIGNFTQLLEEFGLVTAIDIEKSYLPKVKQSSEKVTVGYGDIEKGKYYFKQKKFDAVVCLNVLEHIKDDQKAMENLYRLLKPKGYVLLLVPGHQSLFGNIDKSIGHFRRYDKKSLQKILYKKGFKIIESKRLNLIGALGWYVSGKILKEEIVRKNKMRAFNLVAPIFLFFEKLKEPPFGTSILIICRK